MKRHIFTFSLGFFTVTAMMAQAPTPLPAPPTLAEDNTLVDGGPDETIPFFPGCKELEYESKRNCSESKMLEFVAKNIRYPAKARRRHLTGMVYTSFIVEKDGSLSNFVVLKDIGGGCGKEVIRMLKSMPKWEPGTQRGKPVRVKYTLPVRFHFD